MTAVADAKTVSAPFSNTMDYVRVTWDYAVDGGATGALDLLTAGEALVIKSFHAYVKTTVTTSATGTIQVGVASGDDDACMTAVQGAAASLTAGVTVPHVSTTCPVSLASGGKMQMTIGTGALTAGKVQFVFGVMKP